MLTKSPLDFLSTSCRQSRYQAFPLPKEDSSWLAERFLEQQGRNLYKLTKK